MRWLPVVILVTAMLPGCEKPLQPVNDTAYAATKETPSAPSEPAASAPTTHPDATSSTPADSIETLNDKLESLGARVVAEPPPNGEGDAPHDYASLAAEVSELRAEVKRLQETIDLTISYVVGDLQEENRRLREEIARVYGAGSEGAGENPDIVYLNPEAMPVVPESTPESDAAEPSVPAMGDGGYAVVKEWGRAPEEVAALGKNIPSLKGMICLVPPALNDADLSAIGRAIRAEFDAYDNIVIEVFDDETAAKTYAESNTRSTQHNVLSIQKDGASGRDHILLNRNGVSIAVPR